jgi:putative membrane protein
MAYFWLKAFHIIGFVTWFAGLFYLVRLFVYHAEANDKPEPARSILKQQYELMEKRLYSIITTPGMFVTVVMAIGLIGLQPDILQQPWLQVKIALVLLLLGYHHYCKQIMKQLAAESCTITAQQFRWLNEGPTIFLVVIVMLAVFKSGLPTDLTSYVVVGLVLSFAVSIQLYARKRRLDEEKLAAATPDAVVSMTDSDSSTSEVGV